MPEIHEGTVRMSARLARCTDEQVRAVGRYAARNADGDVEACREVLDMLGLTERLRGLR